MNEKDTITIKGFDITFTDELSHSYEFREKHICTHCKNEEWL